MNSHLKPFRKLFVATVTVIGAMTAMPSFAADTSDPAKAQYEAERARCMSGTTGQDQASCLRSAGAAYDSIKQGRLQDPNRDYRENALARCKTLPAADRADCESRVSLGVPHSMVKGGGDLKETVTQTVGPVTTAPASR